MGQRSLHLTLRHAVPNIIPLLTGNHGRDLMIGNQGTGTDTAKRHGTGRPPSVKSFKATTLALVSEFESFDSTFRGGVFVG